MDAQHVVTRGIARLTARENVRCALCGSREAKPRVLIGGTRIVECVACGLVRQAGAIEPLAYGAAYFTSERSKGGYSNYVRDAAINRRTFGARLERITSRVGVAGRLLDVGCALGDFVLEASQQGWSAEGLEVSEFAASEARRRGANVHVGRIEAGAPGRAYDVVTVYDTLEHTADPVAMLRSIALALAPGGLVHIVTPNVDGIQARLLGRHWYHYKPGEHLVYFGPRTLERAVRTAGLVWEGWSPAGSFVTVSYVLDRMRAYVGWFHRLADAAARAGVGSIEFYLLAGEMECWAQRPLAS